MLSEARIPFPSLLTTRKKRACSHRQELTVYSLRISEESKILLSCLDYRVSSSKYNKFSNNVLSRTSNYKSFYIQEKGVLLEANNSSRLLYDCTYLMKNNMYKLNEKNNTLEFITDMSRSIFDIINLVPVKAYIAKLMLFS